MLKLNITHQVKKFLDKLPPKQFRQIVNKIMDLMMDPRPIDCAQLQGYPFQRVDIGEYRIVYRVENDCLMVACVGKRNDDEVYRLLKRK